MKEDRRDSIKEILRAKGEVKLRELEETFPEYSSMTLRRDLQDLENKGYVKRTRGGAVALSRLSPAAEHLYSERAQENVEQKLTIARKAQRFIELGRSIYIDSGSTMMYFSREMPDEHLSILTSGVNIALELLQKTNPMVTLIGGQLNRSTISVSGVNSAAMIREVNIDTAFIAASGYAPENGFTSGIYTESELKKEVIRRARRTVILMDSFKVDRVLTFTFATLEDIDVLVSDGNLPPSVIERAQTCGVEVL